LLGKKGVGSSMGSAADIVMRIAVVDDDQQNLSLIHAALANQPVEVVSTANPLEALELVRRKRPHVVLLDMVMPGLGGMELLEGIVEEDPGIDVILMTGHYTTESAVEAIKKGACDYLTKPIGIPILRAKVEQFISRARLRRRSLQLETELLEAFQFEGMVGRSPLMLTLFDRIRRVAPHFRTVLVTGQTGTGKELVAKVLHMMSPVSAAPFVISNTSALVETLLESELFGHVRGAFTGATQDKPGLFEYANNGTLFLDEIGEMSLGAQAKLLRVLQTQEIQRVGSPAVRKLNVRVIAATNRDLRAMVSEKTFREDLFYRLSMVEINLPTLAERKEDLPLLTRHFLKQFSEQYCKPLRGLTRRAQTLLARYSWPGNIRELENIIGHACMMAEGEVIDVRDLPESLHHQQPEKMVSGDELLSFEEVKRQYASQVLEALGGNKVRTAQILGISRTQLYRLLKKEEKPEQLDS
jgi:DNA-binding NtrC family response regulator